MCYLVGKPVQAIRRIRVEFLKASHPTYFGWDPHKMTSVKAEKLHGFQVLDRTRQSYNSSPSFRANCRNRIQFIRTRRGGFSNVLLQGDPRIRGRVLNFAMGFQFTFASAFVILVEAVTRSVLANGIR